VFYYPISFLFLIFEIDILSLVLLVKKMKHGTCLNIIIDVFLSVLCSPSLWRLWSAQVELCWRTGAVLAGSLPHATNPSFFSSEI